MAKRHPTITLVHSIICDDIRREDNGKFILIGVYPEIIMLSAIPAQIVLAFWLQFRMYLLEKITLELEIRGDALQQTIPFSLDLEDRNLFGKHEAIPLIVKLPFNIKAEGSLSIYYRKKGDADWQLAQTIHVARNAAQMVQ